MAGRGEQQRGGVIGEDRGSGRGEEEEEEAMDEEAQGHSPLKKMKERQKPGRKNGVRVSVRAEG